jgi:uncharacterized protein DUF3108
MKGTYMKKFGIRPEVCIVLLITLLVFTAGYSARNVDYENARKTVDPENLPFIEDERILYNVTWAGIRAGEFLLEYKGIEKLNGLDVYHFRGKTRSAGVVKWFYKIEDELNSYVDVKTFLPVKFVETLKNKKRVEEITLDFDWDKMEVLRSKVSRKRGESKRKNSSSTLKLEGPVQEFISSFYFMRLQGIEVGDTLTFDVCDGKKIWQVSFEGQKGGRVKSKEGKFNSTILLMPKVKEGGKELNKGTFRIWQTNDATRVPVLLKGRVKMLGTVSAKLTDCNLDFNADDGDGVDEDGDVKVDLDSE